LTSRNYISATSIVEEAWDKVVDTIKAIEKEYQGLKQHQMVNLTRRLLLVLKYYGYNDLQVRGSENEIRKNYLCRQSQRYKGASSRYILKSLSFLLTRERLTEKTGQSKDLGK
jgi:hypothetical protein